MKTNQLIETISKVVIYGFDWASTLTDDGSMPAFYPETELSPMAYVIACFLAQHTRQGSEGVGESDVAEELTDLYEGMLRGGIFDEPGVDDFICNWAEQYVSTYL